MFFLGLMIAYIVLGCLAVVLGGGLGASAESGGILAGPFMIIIGLFALAVFVPALAVQVRRFHDQDKSGWFVLLNFIPYIGGLIVLVFMFLEGTRGPNRFGPDPKAGETVAAE